jgi:hypothetical protein
MKNSPDARRQINNELKARGHNQRAKKILEEHTPKEALDTLTVDFYCECSDAACNARVPLTFEEYDKLHSSEAAFVLAPGHQSPAVEKVTKANDDHMVVEKYAL